MTHETSTGRRIDREHLRAFARFLWQRFLDDKCFETAGALSYTTLFAIVPLLVAAFALLSAFPGFAGWRATVSDFVFRNFVPAAGEAVQGYLLQFADNASRLTAAGVLALLLSALLMMTSIEARFNRIWRVQTVRRGASRFLLYWAALTAVPLALIAGVALGARVLADLDLGAAVLQTGLAPRLLALLPFASTFMVLLAMYKLVPNRSVAWRHAALGALLAALLFEIARGGFAIYVHRFASYQQIYGALAAAPVFLIWIYVSWSIVLLGASFAAALAAFEYRPANERLPPGCEFIGLLRVLRHFVTAQREGEGLRSDVLRASEAFLSDDLLQRYLGDLLRAGMLARSESGAWLLVRDLRSVELDDLYRAGRYHLPADAAVIEPALAGLNPTLQAALRAAVAALHSQLALPLARLYGDTSLAQERGSP